ncbi:MAG: PilZ domain-containing protein [Deltaproteobacteria bacterium]|nr:PilZ domain-containing protein [Deltaproteobacteria bacterium]
MEDPEIITGERMLGLIDMLKRERIALKLNIAGSNNEGLSILLGIKKVNGNPCLMLDFPAGAHLDMLFAHEKKANIEFIDKKKIHYNFRSTVEDITPRNIYILMPKAINRIQRRRFFRISPPLGTKIIINDELGKFEFSVINISEGGVLTTNPAAFHDERIFFQGAEKSLAVVCREDGKTHIINIKKAQLKRINKVLETHHYNYAFDFIDCGRQEENEIRNFIYSCQRRFLEKRQTQEEDMF